MATYIITKDHVKFYDDNKDKICGMILDLCEWVDKSPCVDKFAKIRIISDLFQISEMINKDISSISSAFHGDEDGDLNYAAKGPKENKE